MNEFTTWQQLKQEWNDMGPTVTLSRCPSCNNKRFGETTLIIKHINWGEEITICDKCGYRKSFVPYELGHMMGVRIIIDEWADKDCSVKPNLLTDGGET